jgi:phospholipase C
VAPPKADQWGPGPAHPSSDRVAVCQKGRVDSTPNDTTSIIKLITRRFNLDSLPGVRKDMGDLTNALE